MSTSDPGLRAALKIARTEQKVARLVLLDAPSSRGSLGQLRAQTAPIADLGAS
jgi:hypothetical protein